MRGRYVRGRVAYTAGRFKARASQQLLQQRQPQQQQQQQQQKHSEARPPVELCVGVCKHLSGTIHGPVANSDLVTSGTHPLSFGVIKRFG